jgi:serine/threonine protein kinase
VIHAGRDVPTGDVVAIKLEHRSIAPSLLRQEIEIYEELIGQPGIPRVFWHGYHCDFQAMVFELLGPNLEDLFRYCDNKFSLKTTLMLMDQLLHRVESLHAAGYLHRDIKPENFLSEGFTRPGHESQACSQPPDFLGRHLPLCQCQWPPERW